MQSAAVMLAPGLNLSFVGGCRAAFFDTGNFWSSVTRPSSTSSNSRYRVISLVSDAGYLAVSASSATRTAPVA